MPRKEQQHFKLVLLGDASVGKSCLVARFAKDEFFENQEPTIGAAYMTQTIEHPDTKQLVKYQIWDTAGQERYRSLAPMYYRGAAAAVIVYDVTNKDSFEGAKSWVNELQQMSTSEGLVISLCGNKIDLLEESDNFQREVDLDDAKSYAQENGVLFFETSARTGYNVRKTFEEIGRRLPLKRNSEEPMGQKLTEQQNTGYLGSYSSCCGGGGAATS